MTDQRTATIVRDDYFHPFRRTVSTRWRIDLSNGLRKYTRTLSEAIDWCEELGYEYGR